jgi:hypothetical protein
MSEKVFQLDFDPQKFVQGVESALNEINKFESGTEGFDNAIKELQKTVNNVSFNKPITEINKLKSLLEQSTFKLNFSEVNKEIDGFLKNGPAIKKFLDQLKAELANVGQGSAEFKELSVAITTTEAALKELEGTASQTDAKFVPLKTRIRELKNEMTALEDQGKENTAQYQKLSIEAAKLTDQLGDQAQRIRTLSSDTYKLDAGVDIIRTFAAGWQLAEGALALTGNTSEEFQKTLVKLNALMAISNGLLEINTFLTGQSAGKLALENFWLNSKAISLRLVTASTQTATAAQKGYATAIAATGIGAFVVLLGVLVSKWNEVSDALYGVTEQQKLYNEAKLAITTGATQERAPAVGAISIFNELEQLDPNNQIAVAKYIEIYNDNLAKYFGAIKTATELATFINKYRTNKEFQLYAKNLLINESELKSTKEQIDKFSGEVSQINISLTNLGKERTEYQKALDALPAADTQNRKFFENRINFFTKSIESLDKKKKDLLNNIQKFSKDYIEANKQVGLISQKLGTPTTTSTTTKARSTGGRGGDPVVAQRKELVEDLERINKEIALIDLDLYRPKNLQIIATKYETELKYEEEQIRKKYNLIGATDANLQELLRLNKLNYFYKYIREAKDFLSQIQDVTKGFLLQSELERFKIERGFIDILNEGYNKRNASIKQNEREATQLAKTEYDNRNKELKKAVDNGTLLNEESYNKNRKVVLDNINEITKSVAEASKKLAAETDPAKRKVLQDFINTNDALLIIQNENLTSLTELYESYTQLSLDNTKNYEAAKAIIQIKSSKEQIESDKELYRELTALANEYYGLDLALIDKDTTDKKIKLAIQYKQGTITRKQYHEQIRKIDEEARRQRADAQIKDDLAIVEQLKKQIEIESNLTKRLALQKEKILAENRIATNKSILDGLDKGIELSDADKRKLEKAGDVINELLADIFGVDKNDERFRIFAEEATAAINEVTNAYRDQAQAAVDAADAAVTSQQKRVDEAQKIAEKGNAAYLKEETDQLRELESKREAAARRQIQIDAAVRTSQLLLALAQGISKGVATAQTAGGAALGIATIVASIVAALGQGAAISSSLSSPRLAEGTDSFGRNDMTGGVDRLSRGRYRSGTDTIPAWLNEGEAVISTNTADKYQPTIKAIRRGLIPHDVMNQFVNNYRGGINYDRIGKAVQIKNSNATDMSETNNRLKRLEGLFSENLAAVQGMKVNVAMDSDGFAASISTHLNRKNKIFNA